MDAPEGILNDPCRGFYVFSKMDMIFEDEDEDGRRADFAIGVAQNAILKLKILKISFFLERERENAPKEADSSRGVARRGQKGRFPREGSRKVGLCPPRNGVPM